MESAPNGTHGQPPFPTAPDPSQYLDDGHVRGTENEPSQEELQRELPVVYDGQVPLGELLSRVVQSIYAELTEMAETLPNMSDSARKRTLADWVVKTKKQVVKLFAVVKWARDADDVQKAMNITAFLMDQNRQFEDAIQGIIYAKDSLAPARLRNHDLLTSLDVLTTGTYLRLPSAIKKFFIPSTPLTNAQVHKTLKDMEDLIRFRLRMHEIIPIEMSHYRIADGRVHFTVPNLFETSICLRGAQKDDGWFFVHVEFLHNVGGDLNIVQEFPREPTNVMKRHIADEADSLLGRYLPVPVDEMHPPEIEPPKRPLLPAGTVDAPLIRLFNFLQMMSLSYQLEILFFQAQRMRSLGWAEYLTVKKGKDSKSIKASYWIRPNPTAPGRPPPPTHRPKVPLLGGTLTIALAEAHAPAQVGGGPARTPRARVLADLQASSKCCGAPAADALESLRVRVRWEPAKGALGVIVPAEHEAVAEGELDVDPQNLDFEKLLRKAILKHIHGILRVFQHTLQYGPSRAVFSPPGEVMLVSDNDLYSMRVHLCADEVIIVSIDPRTGRLTLRDTGDLAAAGRGPRCALVSDRINENPLMIYEALVRLRYSTITDLAEQKANYLGLQCFRTRNFSREESAKWGPAVRAHLFIQLASFPRHYLVLVITDEEFRFALISVRVLEDSAQGNMLMDDLGWLDVQRIHGGEVTVRERARGGPGAEAEAGQKRARDGVAVSPPTPRADSFRLDTAVLRELYAYCCARVAYTKVEVQLKLRHIPYTRVNPEPMPAGMAGDGGALQSALARSVPALCVQSRDILAGAPAAEAAMPNIRVVPLNWWAARKSQVVMCVKLKYVQQPVGKHARRSGGGGGGVIRPSRRIIYDPREAVVSFLSENVDTCVDEFLEEWAKVSKMVVIAREVSQMAQREHWDDVRLLAFDLQTVEFAYAEDYAVSITCTDPLSPAGGAYSLRFSCAGPAGADDAERENPHAGVGAEPHLRSVLQHARLAASLTELVSLLRDSLPVAAELAEFRAAAAALEGRGVHVDVLAKAAGWYRVLYGDMRHALDFRLMSGRRVAVLDAAQSLGTVEVPAPAQVSAPTATAPASALTPVSTPASPPKPKPPAPPAGSSQLPPPAPSAEALGVLRPIPGFGGLVRGALRDAVRGGAGGRVAQLDGGLVCGVGAVRRVARALHARVLAVIAEGGEGGV